MVRWLVAGSLKFRLLVLAIAVALLGIGINQLRSTPVDVLPEFTPPYVEVQTEALGLSSDEVEQLITVPLEADLLNGVEGVDVIRSQSVPGMSSIVMVFRPGTDLYRARLLVQERLIQAHALPNVSTPPTVLQPLSSSSRVLMIGISGDRLTPIQKSVIARWTMKPRLMGVPGVANVAVWGMRDQQLQVQVDPEQLRARGVTLSQVVRSAGNAQIVSPLTFLEASTPGTGGFIETPQQRMQVRNVLESLANPDELGKVAIEGTGGRMRLSDVAEIKVDHQPLIGDAVVNNASGGLLLVVEKFPGAGTVEVTKGVEDALETLKPGLTGMDTDTSVFRPASFITDAIGNIRTAAIIGGILMALAMAAFLFHWRAVAVSLVAIPVSLVAAALVLDALGETFNAISFAGLAVALALVVDDAVVGAEAIARRLREHRQAGTQASKAAIVLEASREVRSPLAYATIIVLLAIVPVVVMEGRPGAFLEPFALAYALSVAAAMLVALTVTPALSLLAFSRSAPGHRDSPILRTVGPRYDGALSRVLHKPRAIAAAAAGCVLAALLALPLMGSSLVPSFKDREMLVRLDSPPGTSQPKMTEIATRVGRDLRAVPGVENIGAHVGRAITGDRVVDVNSSEIWATIDDDADYQATRAGIERVVRGVRDAKAQLTTYTTQEAREVGALREGANPIRSDGFSVLTGADEPLVVRLFGQDSGVLAREANRVRQMVSEVDGVVEPRVALPPAQQTLEIEVDLDRAQRYGIKPGDVRRAEATLLQGLQVGSIFDKQKVFEVIVLGTPGTRRNIDSVRNLLIDRPGGGHVRLGQVADVRLNRTPAVVQRDSVSRHVDIRADVSGRSVDDVARDLETRLARFSLPLEYHAEVLTQTTSEEMGTGKMVGFLIGCLAAAFLLLQAALRSWRLAVLAFITLPVALAGGVLAALVNGAELSLGAAVGLLAVFGLAVRSGLILIRHLQTLDRGDGETDAGMVRRGAQDRLGPILTTSVALAAIALPVVILGARPGLEVLHPMAVVLLGGLLTSAFVTLFVLPTLFLRFAGATSGTEDEELLAPVGAPGTPPPAPEAAMAAQGHGSSEPDGAHHSADPIRTMSADRPPARRHERGAGS